MEEEKFNVCDKIEQIKGSLNTDLPTCLNNECEFFGKSVRVNYAFAGGGDSYRCYHCYVVIPKQNTGLV